LPKERLLGEKDTLGVVPVPLRVMVCGLPVASSVTVTAPLALPASVGAKLTLITHEPPAAMVEPQLLVSENPAPAATAEMVSWAVPLFVRVTGCVWLLVPTAWLPKLKLLWEKETPGAVPVPPRVTFCGLATALSITESVPLEAPAVVGR
jgi:hypothetical protein